MKTFILLSLVGILLPTHVIGKEVQPRRTELKIVFSNVQKPTTAISSSDCKNIILEIDRMHNELVLSGKNVRRLLSFSIVSGERACSLQRAIAIQSYPVSLEKFCEIIEAPPAFDSAIVIKMWCVVEVDNTEQMINLFLIQGVVRPNQAKENNVEEVVVWKAALNKQ